MKKNKTQSQKEMIEMDKLDWILAQSEWILTTFDWILTQIN